MSLIAKIEAFFEKAGAKLKAAFIAVFGQQAGEQLAASAEAWAKTELGQIAVTVVQGLEAAAGAPTDKKNQAFIQIGQQLAAQGRSIPPSLINFAIEFALQIVRGGAAA